MALSPSIPTSFVPKQPVSPSKRPHSSGSNLFLVLSIVIVVIAVAVSGAVYLYASYLTGVEKTKAAQVTAAENNVSPGTVEQFIKLRDRLSAADLLLNKHVELSQFFTLLEGITLQNVHFNSLKITVNADNSATIDMAGDALNFNALAAESTTFAAEQNVKSAIFSGISVNKDNSVGFSLNATLAPALVTEAAAPTTAALLPGASSSSTPTSASFSNSAVTTATLATSTGTTTNVKTSTTTP